MTRLALLALALALSLTACAPSLPQCRLTANPAQDGGYNIVAVGGEWLRLRPLDGGADVYGWSSLYSCAGQE